MTFLKITFWTSFALVFYAYLGYGIILLMVQKLKKLLGRDRQETSDKSLKFEPEVTLLIAAYNEKAHVPEKIRNSLSLDYPRDKLNIMFVTDGSDDGSVEMLQQYESITVLHEPQRRGKISAINRAMQHVKTPIVIFTDANTNLNTTAIREIVYHYQDPSVGGVSGEKRIDPVSQHSVSGAGEGLYWRYESFLKRLDSNLYTVVGAAGELFSIRTRLFERVEPDTILDDFIISLRIAKQGYRVIYEPNACALESPSFSLKDEMTRKVRICAGGIQSIIRLGDLLNPFRYRMLTIQYVSHRVLRWTLAPLALVLMLIVNADLAVREGGIYTLVMAGQLMFYSFASLGWHLANRKIRIKLFTTPMYFGMMNVAAYIGFVRYLRGKQSVLWEKANRADAITQEPEELSAMIVRKEERVEQC